MLDTLKDAAVAVKDFTVDEVVPRAVGGLKVVGGTAGVAFGAALCEGTFGAGCGLGVAIGTFSADVAYSGAKQVVFGQPAPTVVGQIAGPMAQHLEEVVVGGAGVAGAVRSILLARIAAGTAGAGVGAGPSGATNTIPEITAGTNREMLKQAVGHVQALEDFFEQLAQQINRLSGGSWSAARAAGADGSQIFAGTFGEALVISPVGQLFRGSLAKAGQFTFGPSGIIQPVYKALVEIGGSP